MIPDHIRKALKARRLEERAAAIEALARLDPAEGTPLLVAALRDRYHYVGQLAAQILSARQDPDTAPAVAECFAWMSDDGKARDPGCRIRIELATLLGNLRYSPAADALLTGLRTVQIEPDGAGVADTAFRLRGMCALALSQIRPPGALLEIAMLLAGAVRTEEGYRSVQAPEEAATALGYWGDPAGVLPLVMALAKPGGATPEVVAACMDAVVALGAPEAVSLLAPYLRPGGASAGPGEDGGDTAFLTARAALALARTRHPEVLALLESCLAGAPGAACEPVAIAIANLRSDEARACLMRSAMHPRAAVRTAAAAGLALFPDDEVRALLRRMAENDRDPHVRRAAESASR